MTERRLPDMWVDPEDDPRETGLEAVGEKATLLDYLRRYRITLEMKCEGLEPEVALRRSCAAGALAASRFGAQPSLPTAAEIDAILAQ